MRGARRSAVKRQAGKAVRVAARPAYWRAALHGVAPALEHDDVPFGHDFCTVVDVGAARGQFATIALRRFPRAQLICLEPLPEACRTLQRLLPSERVHILQAAAGARHGHSHLNVAGLDDSSSLLPITERQVAEFPGTAAVRRIDVEVVPLETVLPAIHLARPSLLKIDVQGFELEVLRGARGRLAEFDVIFVECSFVRLYEGQPLADDVWHFLSEHGFRLAGVFGLATGDAGACLQANFLFTQDDEDAPSARSRAS